MTDNVPTTPPPLTDAQRKMPCTLGTLDEVIGFVKDHVARHVAKLDARIKELEARTEMKYVGVFEDGQDYKPGHMATHGGSLWHCNSPTRERPGTTKAWTLAVKRGKDAR